MSIKTRAYDPIRGFLSAGADATSNISVVNKVPNEFAVPTLRALHDDVLVVSPLVPSPLTLSTPSNSKYYDEGAFRMMHTKGGHPFLISVDFGLG
jgi:hypothetical protein